MHILIIGACSAIAKAYARRMATKPDVHFSLLARDERALADLAQDLLIRGAQSARFYVADFANGSSLEVLDQAQQNMARIDIVLMAHGILGDQAQFEQDTKALERLFYINSISSMNMLTLLANRMEKQASGSLVFISSVAGDRGRASNYAYGASKAVVNTFLQGLRVRLSRVGVQVLTVKPGFVDTPMTASIEKKGLLWAQPDDIADGIEKAIVAGKSEVYLPWFWRIIMGIIVRIPQFIFNKLKL